MASLCPHPASLLTRARVHAVFRIEGGNTGPGLQPCRQQRIKAFTYADTLQLLAADGAVIIAQGIVAAHLQPVDAKF